jgi:hypothetical protein
MKGTLIVKPVSAILRYDTRVFLTMCPFCVFTMDNQAGTTRPCKNGGKQPNWQGQSVELQKKENGFSNFILRVELIDEQLWSDENIGQTEVPIDRELDIARKGMKTVTVPILRKGIIIGEMTLILEWEPVSPSVKTSPQIRNVGYQYNQPNSQPMQPSSLPKIKRSFTADQMDNLLAD